MSTAQAVADHARSAIQQQEKADWLRKLARLGYASRGVIYLVIGGLATLSAFGQGGEVTDSKGAISKLLESPGGWLIVLVLALGLIGYSVWRFVQALYDTDRHGTDTKGLAVRAGLLTSGATHVLLAGWAAKVALGYATGADSSGGKESLVRMLMSQPFGQWLVGGLGLILIGVGIAHLLKGHGEKFEKRFTWNERQRRFLNPVCKAGLFARGVVFAIIGSFIIYAAVTTDPDKAGGLPEALQWLGSQAYGPWLLAAVAVGLFCFGVYSIVEAVYRRVNTPS